MSTNAIVQSYSQQVLQLEAQNILILSLATKEDPFDLCERFGSSPELNMAVDRQLRADGWQRESKVDHVCEIKTSSGDRETTEIIEYKKTTGDTTGIAWWPPKSQFKLAKSGFCAECQGIDFKQAWRRKSLLIERSTEVYKDRIKDSEGIEWLVNASNCHFCRYLVNARRCRPGIAEAGKFYINMSTKLGSPALRERSTLPLQVYIWVSYTCNELSRKDRYTLNKIICHAGKPQRLASVPQIVPPFLNGSLAKLWLEACRESHPECAEEDDLTIPETRLIDCHTRKLISVGSADRRRPFIALSYVWGLDTGETFELVEGESQRLQLPDSLPRTIEDAIVVTKSLGFDYLWVDQFCINQKDVKDQERQIRHMDLIYKCADVTVIAAAGSDRGYGIPGVSSPRKHLLEPFILKTESPSLVDFTFGIFPSPKAQWQGGSWHTRGWTFQEALLSRRRLVFSESKMHFECKYHGQIQREEYGGVESLYAYDYSIKKQNKADGYQSVCGKFTLSTPFKIWWESVRHKSWAEALLTYTELATQYTTRDLSLAKDGLNAFRGVANSLQRFDKPIYSIAGIPFVVFDHDNLSHGTSDGDELMSEVAFSFGLSWRSKYHLRANISVNHTTNDEFPTWSWANTRVWNVTWDLKGSHDCIPADEKLSIFDDSIDFLGDLRVDFVDGDAQRLLSLAEFAEACRGGCDSSHSTTPSQWKALALCFKARILSSRITQGYHHTESANDLVAWGVFFGDPSNKPSSRHPESVMLVIHGDTGPASQSNATQLDCDLQIDDSALFQDIGSKGCGLVLLRYTGGYAFVLTVKWLNGPEDSPRIAQRSGILKFTTGEPPKRFYSYTGRSFILDKFLRCFPNAADVRLI